MAKRIKRNNVKLAPTKSWTHYQSQLRKQTAKKKAVKRLPLYMLALVLLLVLNQGFFWCLDLTLKTSRKPVPLDSVQTLEQSDLCTLLSGKSPEEVARPGFLLEAGMREYQMRTSINPELQQTVSDNIDKKHAKYLALVAMEPESGNILAMASFDRTGANSNVCTRADFPAASLFKIVTAAAAVEELGFTCSTQMAYNGRKYTLYKSQLEDRHNKYTRQVSFAESFADSINPVFGKIGIHRLKKAGLEKYAKAFGFNRAISFDLPLGKSPLAIEEKPYNWAEIACGFNRQTRISPLHAAMMVCGIANGGEIMQPALIQSVKQKNELVYKRQPRLLNQAVTPHSASVLKKLMQATIVQGTARGEFRSARRHGVLSKLVLGGKTGSINNNPLQIKYDWFAGFAEEPDGTRSIGVAVFVAHKKYIGTRASTYAKMVFNEFFKQSPEKKQA
ncbi:MAG: penicillin-binding transpeptidase domain-containing protein [Desulfosalsimonadaceae bacterium]